MNRTFFFFLLLACLSTPARGQDFHFAWLSDTHIGNVTAAEDLGRSVRDINSMDSIAFVLLTGDITEMGSDAQLALAKTILDSLTKPYYIVPGNHDTKWSESGCNTFKRLWGNDRFVFEHGPYRFFGLHQGPIMKMGDGHFAPEDLRWMDSVLAGMPDPNQPLFFVTHYPLDPGIDNWYTMTDLLRTKNIQAVLMGHGHRNRIMDFEGIPGVMGRSNLRARRDTGAYTIATVRTDSMFFSERTPGIQTHTAWHNLPIGRHEYGKPPSDASRPDFSVNAEFPRVTEVWATDTRFTIASTPAVWNDHLVVGNSSGSVSCFSLTDGSEHWTFETGGTVYSSPDIVDGKAVIGSSDNTISCLDVLTGKLLWQVKTGAAVVGAAAIKNRSVYIGASDGKFRSLDLATGTVNWEFAGLEGFVETKALVNGENVIFGAWDTRLYCLDRKSGQLEWSWSNGNRGVLLSPAAVWPVAADGKIFIAAPDRYMTAIDAETGKTIWRTNRFQVRETVGLSEDSRRIYARCMNDTVVAFSAEADTAQPVWITNCGYGYDIDPSMPLEKDGTVFFGTKNGLVYALDGATGAIRWRHKIGVTVVHTPVPLDARRVLVADLDGRIVLLEEK
ncbi:MAG TPA: PQQ-binding-like beta-propeller repeat protein [Bacteroidota bacterium]